MGMNFFAEKMHPDDLARLSEHVQQVVALADDEIIEPDYRMKNAGGEWRWLSSREIIFTRTPEGQPHVVLSLFRLQARYTNDRHALEMFRESQDRVQSMALVHQKLYQSADLARFDFAECLRSLTTSLLRSYQTDTHSVTLTILVDDLFLDIDQAIRCGLIINELISNNLKYAFPDNRAGKIQIELRRTVDN